MSKFLLFTVLLLACQKEPDASILEVPVTVTPEGFAATPQVIALKNGMIVEASGMADSKRHAGYLWVQEDSGNPPAIYLLKHDGTIADTVLLEGAVNRDWEDMVLAGDQLYIGDIGDNNAEATSCRFYRFAEPARGVKKTSSFDVIEFRYPDGAHDAEAFLVDPGTKDIYVFTKRDAASKVFKLPYPQSTTSMNVAVPVRDLDYTGVVSAALSPDGKEFILKTYTRLYYYTKRASDAIPSVLGNKPVTLAYLPEMQGEAVAFRADNKGFYTLSERAFNVDPSLRYYQRQ
ncbi:hypothetical protein [Paraflavitalea pollutisoli]|uniref:hypothetical protein n=1 Tax=Paraflavitalea pollutisoli TaxID=3034143 RepID=UPI0023ED606D|nr:hypothetical protein [Paraflavitalea sp. H1-2-19X]